MSARPVPATVQRPSLHAVLTRTYLGLTWLSVSVTSLALTFLAIFSLRGSVEQSLHVIARSMSYNVEAAVVFQDRPAAYKAMASLAETSLDEIENVRVYDVRGQLLATWQRPAHDSAVQSAMIASVQWLMPDPITQPILHDGVPVGSLLVTGYGGRLAMFLVHGLIWLLICLSLSAIWVFYFARRLANDIVAPLQELAQVTHAIRGERAFDQRVPEAPISELNELGKDFNALLAELDTWERRNRREHARLTMQATRDDLTGLVKRATFNAYLRHAVAEAIARNRRVALLFIDVDLFKQINDRFGHAAGDAILVGVADRISAQLRQGDLAARLGGDEFAVVLQSLNDADDAVRVAERLHTSMSEPVALANGERFEVSMSIGVAVLPDHATSVETLMAAADAAMYRAKRDPAHRWRLAQADVDPNHPEGDDG